MKAPTAPSAGVAPSTLTQADLASLRTMIEEVVDAKVTVALTGGTLTAAPSKPAKAPVKAPKADARYRSTAQLAKGHAEEAAIYARYRAETGKGFKAMSAAKQKACRTEIKAVWSALKGTRKTKA